MLRSLLYPSIPVLSVVSTAISILLPWQHSTLLAPAGRHSSFLCFYCWLCSAALVLNSHGNQLRFVG